MLDIIAAENWDCGTTVFEAITGAITGWCGL
jgi:hypothetical protein